MNELIWKPETEMNQQLERRKLERRKKEWKQGESRDGNILYAEGLFEYKGILYAIKVLKYYTLDKGFKPLCSSRKSECHAVVEYPKCTEPIAQWMNKIDIYNEFLYHDTLHAYNDCQTCDEQIEEAHTMAKRDIDYLFGKEVIRTIDAQLQELRKIKANIYLLKLKQVKKKTNRKVNKK